MPNKMIVNLLQLTPKQTALILSMMSSETYGTDFWNKERSWHM